MSRLYGAARQASEYVRRRFDRSVRNADRQIDQRADSDYMQSRRSLGQRLADFVFGRRRRGDGRPTEPPPPPGQTRQPRQRRTAAEWLRDAIGGGSDDQDGSGQQPPGAAPPRQAGTGPNRTGTRGGGGFGEPPSRPATGFPSSADDDDELGPGDFQLLGRDATYDPEDWRVVMDQMRVTPGSSNVYGYYYERESRTTGILYVTFLGSHAGNRGGAGPTYAYYTVPTRKYQEFQRATAASAGGAVWDYLRVRGSSWRHQYNYRLVQSDGDYIPRKSTRRGFRTRNLVEPGVGRRSFRRSTLEERLYSQSDTRPDRGQPDRGERDRGD